MKKIIYFATLACVLLMLAIPCAAELNKITARGESGNLVFYNSSGEEVFSIENDNRQLSVPEDSALSIEQNGMVEGLALKVASIVMAGVDYTLSTAEALCNILNVTGSPSGQSIIAPTLTTSGASLLYTVRNAGSDSNDVYIKASGQTGVAIATGKTAEVYFLTDDYVRKTADATH